MDDFVMSSSEHVPFKAQLHQGADYRTPRSTRLRQSHLHDDHLQLHVTWRRVNLQLSHRRPEIEALGHP